MSTLEEIDAALILLRRLWTHAGTFQDPTLGAVDLSTVLVCREIASLEPEVSVADVAAGLGIAHSTASRLVDRAEQTGAVRRTLSARDARRASVELTAEGRQLDETASRFRLGFLDQAMAGWSQADLDRFARLLTRFAEAASQQPPGGQP